MSNDPYEKVIERILNKAVDEGNLCSNDLILLKYADKHAHGKKKTSPLQSLADGAKQLIGIVAGFLG